MDTTFLREISLLVRSPKKGIDEIFWFGTLEKGIKAGLAGWCATHILGFALGIILLPLAMTFGGFLLLGGRAGDLFGRKRLFLIGLVVFSLAIMLVSTNITATNAESELQTVQEKVSKVQAKNTSAAQEISELSSRSRLNKIAKQYGLSLNNGSIRNVYK